MKHYSFGSIKSTKRPYLALDLLIAFYFESEYFLASTHVLFELATDGPGFFGDEPAETAGEILALPPLLEAKEKKSKRMFDL